MRKCKVVAAVLLIAAALGGGSFAPAAETRPTRLDRYGDPLPLRAVARIGTVRWWCGINSCPLVFAPDGKSLALGEDIGIVRFLDTATGKELRRIAAPDAYDMLFALAPDGKTVVTGSSNGGALLRLWEVSTGKQLRQITDGEIETTAAAFSPDGKIFAAATTEKAGIRLWDTTTWKEMRQLKKKSTRESDSLFFLPDGKILLTGDPQSIRWWDIRTGREIRRLDKDIAPGVYWQTVVSAGKRLAAIESSNDKKGRPDEMPPDVLRLWEADTGKEISRRELKHNDGGYRLCFSPDGQTLACSRSIGERGNQTRFFAAETGRELRHWDDGDDWAYDVTLSPDGKILAQQNVSGVIHLRDAATGRRIGSNLGLEDFVLATRFAPDGKTLIALMDSGRAGVWDPLTGKQIGRWQAPPKDFAPPYLMQGAMLTADGAKGAQVDAKGVLHVWETATGKLCCRIADPPPRDTKPTFSPDGRILAVDHKDGVLRFWDTTTGKVLRTLSYFKGTFCHLVAFSPDGRVVATQAIADLAVSEKAIRLWETATGKELGRLTWRDEEMPMNLMFSADGKHLLTTHASILVEDIDTCSVRLWDVAARREWRRFTRPLARDQDGEWWGTMALSPDGKTLAATSKENIFLWELASGQERGRLIGHREEIKSLAFSADGRLLASGGRDHTALVWDMTGICPDGQWSCRDIRPSELEHLWTDLAGSDSVRAYRAVWTMAAARQAVPFLAQRLRPAPRVAEERLQRLIADLDSDQFETRRRASEDLEQLRELAEPAMRKALASKPSLEVRQRLRALLDPLEHGTFSSEELRVLRSLEVLEHADTPNAQQLLQTLAKGASQARLTREAKASLQRLAKRRHPKP